MILEINNPSEYLLAHENHNAELTRLEDETIYGIPTGDIYDYFVGALEAEGIIIVMTDNDVAILTWFVASGSVHINTLGSTGGELGKLLVTHMTDKMFPLATIEVLTGESPTLYKYYQRLGFSVVSTNQLEVGKVGYISMILER